jgi:hypothetical protein
VEAVDTLNITRQCLQLAGMKCTEYTTSSTTTT